MRIAVTFYVVLLSALPVWAESGIEAKEALEKCLMQAALRYTVGTCEPAEAVYTASVGSCRDERKAFEHQAFQDPEYQAIPFNRREALIQEFIDGYRPIIFSFVLEGRAQSDKICN